MEKTPRKNLRLNISRININSPIQCSRPSYEIHAFTQFPIKEIQKVVEISSTKIKINSTIVTPKQTKRKGKEKVISTSLPNDSDFEDKIPIAKRIRVNVPSTSTIKARSKPKKKQSHW